MKKLTIVSIFALCLVVAGSVMAANTASHDITLTVSAVNEVAVAGGNITLTVNTATAGAELDAVTDATTSLDWTTNEATRKITVATDIAVTGHTLKLTPAIDTGSGSASAQLTLSDTAQDVVTAFGTEVGGAGLTYEASATASQGTSSSTYTVTYTLTAGV